MIKTHQAQNRRVEIVDMHAILYRLESEFIRRSVHISPTHAAARHPHGKAVMIVIAAVDFSLVAAFLG